MSWSVHMPAGPCETFADRAKAAVTDLHLEQRPDGGVAELAQAAAAIKVAAGIVAEHMGGSKGTHYSASLSGHVGTQEQLGVHVTASHVLQEATQ